MRLETVLFPRKILLRPHQWLPRKSQRKLQKKIGHQFFKLTHRSANWTEEPKNPSFFTSMETHCGDRGDMISSLPDVILLEILSLLDMKYVVQTSVLSKRWRYLWTSVRRLEFDADLFFSPRLEQFDGYRNFVNQVLVLRARSDIDEFRLTNTYQAFDIKSFLSTWVLAVTRRKVQTLSLDIWSHGIQLPTCLFTCTSLTELVLVIGGSTRWRINLPKSMDLPNLKVLQLGFLSFSDENLTNNFFLSCPDLEELTLEDVEFLRMNVNICALKLVEFTVENHSQNYGYCHWIDTKFKLYAPNLSSICCEDYMFSNYILDNLSSLVSANIDMKVKDEDEHSGIYSNFPVEWKQMYAQRMMQFLKGLQYVEDLKLSAWFLEVISGSPDLLKIETTQLCDLTCLRLETWLSRDTICAITYLLKISPIVESLYLEISKMKISSTNMEDYWEEGLPLYNLKFVTIVGAVGCVDELKFLEILLKNAEVLEKLVIFTSKGNSPDKETYLMKYSDAVSTFPRASSNITIVFY